MYLTSFRVQNFRRLKDVRVDLEPGSTVFVGANNSGKTSATHVFQLFLDAVKTPFRLYDFTADCWATLDSITADSADAVALLPKISLDLWFEVDADNVHRVVPLLPSLDWAGTPVGVRLTFQPKDGARLLDNFLQARTLATNKSTKSADLSPWPQSLSDYLQRKLTDEYEIGYYVLDSGQCDDEGIPKPGYEPFYLGNARAGGARILESILRVDFLDAQRHLTDSESRGRAEDLSHRLSRFYQRNLPKLDDDVDALSAISNAETLLNEHFESVFRPTLDGVSKIGYPGMANPALIVKASFNPHSILSSSAQVHYALGAAAASGGVAPTLPDQYNGLGFKNLIYMAIEILDFHFAWMDQEQDRPPVHLIMIEEPEAHLHAQLQQVFVRKVFDLLPAPVAGFTTQLAVTTHSSHILYEHDFDCIRYFCRVGDAESVPQSVVKNLSRFADEEEAANLAFLQQYLKLTHCDLFFADAAVLVEGNVERLLLPLIIRRNVSELRACHLTILEVGGAFAHKFRSLLTFLELKSLIITDLDSVQSKAAASDPAAGDDSDEEEAAAKSACLTTEAGAVTSNETLKQWLPGLAEVDALLSADPSATVGQDAAGEDIVRVVYQRRIEVSWGGKTAEVAGRTLEEAFGLQNLAWIQADDQKDLGLHIRNAEGREIADLHAAIFRRVKTFDKTAFALALIARGEEQWIAPTYIVDGLRWLSELLQAQSQQPAPGPEPEVSS